MRAGRTLGKLADCGIRAVADKIHIHDLDATILHLLGLDRERLTYRLNGREFRLTDVYGRVVYEAPLEGADLRLPNRLAFDLLAQPLKCLPLVRNRRPPDLS